MLGAAAVLERVAGPHDRVAAVAVEVPAAAAAGVPDACQRAAPGARRCRRPGPRDAGGTPPRPFVASFRGRRGRTRSATPACTRSSCGPGSRSARRGTGSSGTPRPSCRGRPRGCRPRRSASELPSRPRTRSAIGSSAGLKPVANMSVSISRSTPSPSTIERSRSSRTPELTRSTFGSWMRRIPPARQEDPLAEDLVVGGEQRAQLGVGDLPAEVEPRVQRLPPGPAAVARQADGHRLDGRVDGCAREPSERAARAGTAPSCRA